MPLRTVTPRYTAPQVRGLFMASPPSEFTDQVASYGEQCKALTKFLDDLEKHAGADVATKARRSICMVVGMLLVMMIVAWLVGIAIIMAFFGMRSGTHYYHHCDHVCYYC